MERSLPFGDLFKLMLSLFKYKIILLTYVWSPWVWSLPLPITLPGPLSTTSSYSWCIKISKLGVSLRSPFFLIIGAKCLLLWFRVSNTLICSMLIIYDPLLDLGLLIRGLKFVNWCQKKNLIIQNDDYFWSQFFLTWIVIV